MRFGFRGTDIGSALGGFLKGDQEACFHAEGADRGGQANGGGGGRFDIGLLYERWPIGEGNRGVQPFTQPL